MANAAEDTDIIGLMAADDLRLIASIALMALAAGRPGMARAMIDLLHVARPGSEVAAVAEAFFLMRQRDFDAALGALDAAAQTIRIRTTRAVVLMTAGRILEAFDLLSEYAGAPADDEAGPAAALYGALAEELSRNPTAVFHGEE